MTLQPRTRKPTASMILAIVLGADGPDSGLDADLLDGQHGAYYLPAASYTAPDVLTKLLTVDGAGTGLDADLLDGQHGSYYRDAGNINAGTLAVARGGTGQTSYTAGDLLYASGTTTLSKLAIGTNGHFLKVAAGLPTYAAITIGDIASGTLAAANGGTGIASYAVGDLLYASGSTTLSKLAAVASGSVLVSAGVTTAPAWSNALTLSGSCTLSAGSGTTLVVSSTQTATNKTSGCATFGGGVGISGTTYMDALVIEKNQNATSIGQITNNDSGTSAAANLRCSNGTNQGGLQIQGVNNTDDPGDMYFYTSAVGMAMKFRAGGANRLILTGAGVVTVPSGTTFVVGSAALATNATDGFIYVPTCAGVPTGAPTARTGVAPAIIDTTNHRWYFYSGGSWRNAGP